MPLPGEPGLAGASRGNGVKLPGSTRCCNFHDSFPQHVIGLKAEKAR